jgi:hypothetical protein
MARETACAVYHALLQTEHPSTVADIALSFGRWEEEATGDDRDRVGLRVWPRRRRTEDAHHRPRRVRMGRLGDRRSNAVPRRTPRHRSARRGVAGHRVRDRARPARRRASSPALRASSTPPPTCRRRSTRRPPGPERRNARHRPGIVARDLSPRDRAKSSRGRVGDRAHKLRHISLADALDLALLVAEQEPAKYPRVALRWHARYCAERDHITMAHLRPCLRCWLSQIQLRRRRSAT